MLPWQFFVNGTTKAAASLVLNANMLTKVYFPRMVIPISAVLPALLDFAIAFVILLGLIFYYHIAVTVNWLFLPIFFLIALVTALAMGIWLSALGMAYRDVRHTVGLLMTAWMYISPVIYPSSMIPPQWRALYSLNPMVAAIEGFRWSLLGKPALNVEGTLVAASVSLLLLITGAYYFRRVERRFADVI
jgi:lipopolysaccharide transport system permease protein